MFPYVFEEALPINMFVGLYDDLDPKRNNDWRLCNISNPHNKTSHTSWQVNDCRQRLAYTKVGSYLKYQVDKYYHSVFPDRHPRFSLVRTYTNGQTFGQLSEFHVDYFDDTYYTVILFTNLEWDTNWGGEFTVRDSQGKYHLFPYIPNQAVLVPSNWSHNGSAPNSKTDALRTTLALSYWDPSCPWK